jgi:hypothetical protein
MKPAYEHDNFAVFDDVFDEATFAELWRYIRTERYEPLARRRSTLFGLLDGNALAGPGVLTAQAAGHDTATNNSYPTGRTIDAVVEALLDAAPELEPWTGARFDAWEYLTCTPFVYPVGAGMSWHHDSAMRSASYIFYAHPEWRSSWGGELLISTADMDDAPGQGHTQGQRVPDEKERRLTRLGLGQFVMSKPNRLVVVRSGVLHAINKVDVSAGEHVRASFAGFFQTGERTAGPTATTGRRTT